VWPHGSTTGYRVSKLNSSKHITQWKGITAAAVAAVGTRADVALVDTIVPKLFADFAR